MTRPLTGWHVAAMFCAGFGIIIAVNLTLAVSAVRTFPGLEVRNSYVASQGFDSARSAQESLGWQARARIEGGSLRLILSDSTGRTVVPETLSAVFGRATHVKDDQRPAFVFDGDAHVAKVDAGPGTWRLRISATAADGTLFRQRIPLQVAR